MFQIIPINLFFLFHLNLGILPYIVIDYPFQRKTWGRLLCIEWAFIAISCLNILGTVGMTVGRLVIVIQESDVPVPTNADFVFCIVLILNGGEDLYFSK